MSSQAKGWLSAIAVIVCCEIFGVIWLLGPEAVRIAATESKQPYGLGITVEFWLNRYQTLIGATATLIAGYLAYRGAVLSIRQAEEASGRQQREARQLVVELINPVLAMLNYIWRQTDSIVRTPGDPDIVAANIVWTARFDLGTEFSAYKTHADRMLVLLTVRDRYGFEEIANQIARLNDAFDPLYKRYNPEHPGTKHTFTLIRIYLSHIDESLRRFAPDLRHHFSGRERHKVDWRSMADVRAEADDIV